jgi:hypothetical protein
MILRHSRGASTMSRFGSTTPAATVIAALALCCAGCGGSDKDPNSLPKASDTPSATSTPSATTTAGDPAAPIPTGYPDVQLTFDLPKVSAAKQPVLRTAVDFERGLFSTLRTAKLSPLVARNGSADMVKFARGNVNYLTKNNTHFAGPISIAFTQVKAGGNVAVVDTCTDGSRAAQVINGAPKPLDPPLRAAIRLDVSLFQGHWKVTSYNNQGGKSC